MKSTLVVIFCYAIVALKAQDCSEAETNEMWSESADCDRRADVKFTIDVISGEKTLQDALCTSITSKHECDMRILSECLPQANQTRVELYVLDQAAQKALNSSENLGEDFVNGCAVFRNKLFGRYMLQVTGSLKCDYIEYTRQTLPAKRECDNAVRARLDQAISISSFLTGSARTQFIETAFCNAYDSWNNECRAPFIQKCIAPKVANEIYEADDESYANLELVVRRINPFFSFASSCSGNSLGEGSGNGDEATDDDIGFIYLTGGEARRRKRSPSSFIGKSEVHVDYNMAI